MFDPFSLAAGAGILAAGFLTGRLARRRSPASAPLAAICGCGCSLALHDPKTGVYHGQIKRGSAMDGYYYEPCTCQQYVGPKPIEDLFAPQYLPPAE
jgi:hypothetical protein